MVEAGWASAAKGSAGWAADAAAGAEVGRRLAACFVVCLAGFGSSLGSHPVAAAVLRAATAVRAVCMSAGAGRAGGVGGADGDGCIGAGSGSAHGAQDVDNCIAGCAAGGRGFEPRPRGWCQDELTD